MNVEQFKDYPEGSGGKRLYDRASMPFDSFLQKYYSNFDRDYAWNRWLKTANQVLDEARHHEFLARWGERGQHFNFSKALSFYQLIKGDKQFDDDVLRFFSFLEGDGFFEHYKLTFQSWISIPNFSNPGKSDQTFDGYTMQDIVKHEYGMDLLRELLPMMYWLRG